MSRRKPSDPLPTRLHVYPASEAEKALILARFRAKLFHFVLWDYGTDELEHGSWFNGKVIPEGMDLSPDGKHMVWGETDWNFKIADVNTVGDEPEVLNTREILRCSRRYKVYHVDLSPDQKWITFTYGPFEGGQQVGGFAQGWNICVGNVESGQWVQITGDGNHNKEPDWVPIPATSRAVTVSPPEAGD